MSALERSLAELEALIRRRDGITAERRDLRAERRRLGVAIAEKRQAVQQLAAADADAQRRASAVDQKRRIEAMVQRRREALADRAAGRAAQAQTGPAARPKRHYGDTQPRAGR